MSVNALRDTLPDFAKDIKLNLGSVLSPEGAPDLTPQQIYLIALSAAFAIKNNKLILALQHESTSLLTEADLQAAKSAATIMAMNNIYYRFIHTLNEQAFSGLPAKLRMNVIANPGIDKSHFELCCLAISALNGCGLCMESHTKTLLKHGVSELAIQSAIRIAAVLNATALSLSIS